MPRVHAGHVLHEQLLSGCTLDSTNNIMELVAAIHGFEALKEPCEVMIFSDSQYLLGLMRGNRANQELVARLRQAMQPHTVQTTKVLAHSGNPLNERRWREARRQADRCFVF